jgi:release factor glutamine methyltransferase
VVSNPPYLSDQEIQSASPEVREYEPLLALHGGNDGLSHLKEIIRMASHFLSAHGLLALETGIHQHAILMRIAKESGLYCQKSAKDLCGRPRMLFFSKSNPNI